jgi:hypothetical protein
VQLNCIQFNMRHEEKKMALIFSRPSFFCACVSS